MIFKFVWLIRPSVDLRRGGNLVDKSQTVSPFNFLGSRGLRSFISWLCVQMSTLILFLFSSNWPRGSLVVSSHQKNISPSIRLPDNVSESLKKVYLSIFLSTHLLVGEEETDQHCVLLSAEHVADVQGAAREEEVEEEGDEDAHGEQQVEAGEPDHTAC